MRVWFFPRANRRSSLKSWLLLNSYGLVPNPDKRVYAPISADSLAKTRRYGNTDFILQEVTTDIRAARFPFESTKPGEQAGVCLEFQVFENSKSTSDWELNKVYTIDDNSSLGIIPNDYAKFTGADGSRYIVTKGDLCTHAPVWKINVGFMRTRNFASNELWRVERVPIPEDHTNAVIDVRTNLFGARLQLRGIIGKNCRKPEERRIVGDWPALHVLADGLGDELRLNLIRVVDDKGREWGIVSSGLTKFEQNFFGLSPNPAEDAKYIDVTFAVAKVVRLEFQGKPQHFAPLDSEGR